MKTKIEIKSRYSGCGYAWAVFDEKKKQCFYVKLNECRTDDDLKEYQLKACEKLEELNIGKVISGIFSCYQFIASGHGVIDYIPYHDNAKEIKA
ncbi:MAG TPA: hypothetical protein DD412_00210 [Holosporales bacterium]|nr:hypothetical protein [Holosporales bacterium]